MSNIAAPRAFVSHASEDKDRFVRDFAKRLRADGVDAWVDEWEMAPGDSLIRRIFDEGIEQADAFIIVVSENSISKPWVREELDAAAVRRIEGTCKLIPVVLDGVSVPSVIKATVWQAIGDPRSYANEYQRILDAVFGTSARPPLGRPPGYVMADRIKGLNNTDSVVLSTACRLAIVADEARFVNGDPFVEALEGLGVSDDVRSESLLALEAAGLLEEVRLLSGDQLLYLKVSWSGLLRYLADSEPDLGDKQQELVAHLINDEATMWEVAHLAERLEIPRLVTEAILVPYESRGLLRIDRFMGKLTRVGGISPLLKRELA